MDGMFYYLILVVLAVLAYTFFQNHNEKLALLMLGIGIYVVYSHETGHTATDFKNETVKSLDESASEWAKDRGADGFDEVGAQKEVK
jgi:c-di-AMP phosphodiesterase-like protein